jgi:hypothetical protein
MVCVRPYHDGPLDFDPPGSPAVDLSMMGVAVVFALAYIVWYVTDREF